jgi:hypothetical protein
VDNFLGNFAHFWGLATDLLVLRLSYPWLNFVDNFFIQDFVDNFVKNSKKLWISPFSLWKTFCPKTSVSSFSQSYPQSYPQFSLCKNGLF